MIKRRCLFNILQGFCFSFFIHDICLIVAGGNASKEGKSSSKLLIWSLLSGLGSNSVVYRHIIFRFLCQREDHGYTGEQVGSGTCGIITSVIWHDGHTRKRTFVFLLSVLFTRGCLQICTLWPRFWRALVWKEIFFESYTMWTCFNVFFWPFCNVLLRCVWIEGREGKKC